MTNITSAEREFMYFQAGTAGSFMGLLIRTMMAADTNNMAKLALGFPDMAMVVYRYQNEDGYWEDLRNRWEQAHHDLNQREG
jgi:hypothetical protein